MKGLELAEQYYKTYGEPMLNERFPELKDRAAAGLVGMGSECFGFDDAFSADHDYGPSFCLWLTAEDYRQFGEALQQAYAELPGSFQGVSKRQESLQGGGRVGVLSIEGFYQSLIGLPRPPQTEAEWLSVPEEALAAAVNGKVFADPVGKFSAIREKLISYYPEAVWKKKMAQCAALMAQSGQYNYSRCMARGEWVAAQLALAEFVKSSMSMAYLLNRKYAPFYKWMHRGIKELTILSEVGDMLLLLTDVTDAKAAWQSDGEGVDKCCLIIEAVCQVIVQTLQEMKLTDSSDSYLETHAYRILR